MSIGAALCRETPSAANGAFDGDALQGVDFTHGRSCFVKNFAARCSIGARLLLLLCCCCREYRRRRKRQKQGRRRCGASRGIDGRAGLARLARLDGRRPPSEEEDEEEAVLSRQMAVFCCCKDAKRAKFPKGTKVECRYRAGSLPGRIDATPARWRGDAGSSGPLDRATKQEHGRVIAEK